MKYDADATARVRNVDKIFKYILVRHAMNVLKKTSKTKNLCGKRHVDNLENIFLICVSPKICIA